MVEVASFVDEDETRRFDFDVILLVKGQDLTSVASKTTKRFGVLLIVGSPEKSCSFEGRQNSVVRF